MAGILLGSILYSIDRYRIARLIELERVRTRIATDLHDDIGSSLSQIAMLSEVTRSFLEQDNRVLEPLMKIADLSRDLVDSMSDIVWAANPKKDRLSDLTQRMRLFAGDLFTSQNIEFDLSVPDLRTSCQSFDDNLKLRLQAVMNGIELETHDLIQLVEDIKTRLAPAAIPVIDSPPNS